MTTMSIFIPIFFCLAVQRWSLASQPPLGSSPVQCYLDRDCYSTREPLELYYKSQNQPVMYGESGCFCDKYTHTCKIMTEHNGYPAKTDCIYCGRKCDNTEQFFQLIRYQNSPRTQVPEAANSGYAMQMQAGGGQMQQYGRQIPSQSLQPNSGRIQSYGSTGGIQGFPVMPQGFVPGPQQPPRFQQQLGYAATTANPFDSYPTPQPFADPYGQPNAPFSNYEPNIPSYTRPDPNEAGAVPYRRLDMTRFDSQYRGFGASKSNAKTFYIPPRSFPTAATATPKSYGYASAPRPRIQTPGPGTGYDAIAPTPQPYVDPNDTIPPPSRRKSYGGY